MRMPPTPPSFQEQIQALAKQPKRFAEIMLAAQSPSMGGISSGPYEHWDKIRFKPTIGNLTPKDMWASTKLKRTAVRKELPFDDTSHRQFFYSQIGQFQRALHEIDSNARGLIAIPGEAANSETRDIYLQKSLIEEPFSSSVLEGAATTREIARKMIEERRRPKSVDEKMVLNNYEAMRFIHEHKDEELTPASVLELHRILTTDTLERPEKAGVLRSSGDDVRVVDSPTGETLHFPPPAEELPARLKRLCDFANGGMDDGEAFMHPIVRAIILHFMLAYDHPFWDGNGRSARALFYWCVLRHNYWLLEYVSISAVIMRAPSKYGTAFLYTETDEGDLTYFIDHQLNVLQASVTDLHDYLEAKSKELKALGRAIGRLEQSLNRRQLALLQMALKNPEVQFGIQQHADTFGVSYLTARSDLEKLEKLRILSRTKEGVRIVFSAPDSLKDRLKRWS